MNDLLMTYHAGVLGDAATLRLDAWLGDNVVQRFWQKDVTLWSAKPVPELNNRLGWLDLPHRSLAALDDIASFAHDVAMDGITDVVLLGMGGSSLAPEVFQTTFGNAPGHPKLTVCDSTHPDAVIAVRDALDLERTVFVVSSKSGGTIETMSFFHYFHDAVSAVTDTPGRHFVAITDPGTSLEALAEERGFRRVFHAPEDVGGRYSALTAFGLVPAAMIGVDVRALVERTLPLAAPDVFSRPIEDNPGLALGAALGEAARAGRDKLTILATRGVDAFPAWIEQLVAESTGKDGRGIVPVLHEPLLDAYGDDRVFVSIELDGDPVPDLSAVIAAGHPVARISFADVLDLGREFYRWEVATAAAGMIMGVQPFDQPDVQLAKDMAKRAMVDMAASPQTDTTSQSVEAAPSQSDSTSPSAEALSVFASRAGAGDYICIQAFLPPTQETRTVIEKVAESLRRRTGVPVVYEFGPRFLHSTGQLHKGGANNGLFLQIADRPGVALAVPGTDYTFDRLVMAQSGGDAAALEQRGRRLLRIVLEDDGPTLQDVVDALS